MHNNRLLEKICQLLFLITVLSFLIGACSPSQEEGDEISTIGTHSTSTPLPSTPILQQVSDFDEGVIDFPSGKYLFVEYSVVHDAEFITDSGVYALCEDALDIDFPTYLYNSGQLECDGCSLDLEAVDSNVVGFFGKSTSNRGSMGGGTSSDLFLIQTLPYQPSSVSSLTIHSVDIDGTIIVTLQGKTYRIEPGQNWVHFIEKQVGDCHRISKYRFNNYGLLDEANIGS